LIRELEGRAQNNPWLEESVKYLRKLLERRDSDLMEKELMYASSKMMNRVADINDSVMFAWMKSRLSLRLCAKR